MSSAERISKRPKTKSVTLIDLPKANTGLAIKAIHKNNTVNDKMDIENIYYDLNINNQINVQDEKDKAESPKINSKKSKIKGMSSYKLTTPTTKKKNDISAEESIKNSLGDSNTDEIINDILSTSISILTNVNVCVLLCPLVLYKIAKL